MTDHNREELIEEAAKAIADVHNVGAFEKWPQGWIEEARAAFAVFEQAHTPTDDERCCEHPKCPGGSLCCCCPSDEREALANLIDDELQSQRIFDLRDMASAILAAGFRRTVQGEPTGSATLSEDPTTS